VRVAIAGGHGKVARETARRLSSSGVDVAAVIRDPSQSADIAAVGGTAVVADIEELDADELSQAIGAVDAVLFAAGAGAGSGPERKWTVDHDGAVKFVEVARSCGAGHYVMLSSMGADADHAGDEVFDVYLRAKGRADQAVRDSGVGYTIVRPTTLSDDPPSGTVDLSVDAGGDAISRADVAAVLAALVQLGRPTGRTVQLTAGTTRIADAVSALADDV
jgi:uncharacterized protein YbjT (DUF2867 family)